MIFERIKLAWLFKFAHWQLFVEISVSSLAIVCRLIHFNPALLLSGVFVPNTHLQSAYTGVHDWVLDVHHVYGHWSSRTLDSHFTIYFSEG